MSTPNQTTPTAAPPQWERTEDDTNAVFASAYWFDMKAPPDMLKPYEGMHVAILGEQILDGDRDFNELARRIEAKGDTIPMTRLLYRYVPTEEEMWTGSW